MLRANQELQAFLLTLSIEPLHGRRRRVRILIRECCVSLGRSRALVAVQPHLGLLRPVPPFARDHAHQTDAPEEGNQVRLAHVRGKALDWTSGRARERRVRASSGKESSERQARSEATRACNQRAMAAVITLASSLSRALTVNRVVFLWRLLGLLMLRVALSRDVSSLSAAMTRRLRTELGDVARLTAAVQGQSRGRKWGEGRVKQGRRKE